MMVDRQLNNSLKKLRNSYVDEGDFLRFPNGMILNFPFPDIDDIYEMYNDYLITCTLNVFTPLLVNTWMKYNPSFRPDTFNS